MQYRIEIVALRHQPEGHTRQSLGVAEIEGDPEEWGSELPAVLEALGYGLRETQRQVEESLAEIFQLKGARDGLDEE